MEKDKDKVDRDKVDKTGMPKESMRDRLLRLGFKVSAPTGRGVVIGTGGPVEKKDDQPK
jgi:hypothetical protein